MKIGHNLNFMKFYQVIFLVILFTIMSCNKNANCSIDQGNAGKRIYDLDEASCFNALELDDKAPTLESIRNALIIEEKYMSEIGLIHNKQIPKKENHSNINLETNELINFALRDGRTQLDKNQLTEIYDAEIGYLKFIGAIN